MSGLMLERIWDNYVVIGEVMRTANAKLVIAASTRDGVRHLNIREFYLRKRDNSWQPGRHGVTVPLAYPINHGKDIIHPYKEFVDIVAKASSTLETMELLNEDNAVYRPKTPRYEKKGK